ncbi:MAG: hypothetical protein CHACPFDD_03602 [Phycisphaerae bacterium]|nr:hypothetical protein [Phycisphaerae bacterium]
MRTAGLLKHAIGLPGAMWAARWSLARATVAASLLLVLVHDNPARLARLQLAGLPDYDYLGEARRLGETARYGEALVVLDAARAAAEANDDAAQLAQIEDARATTVAQRDSYVRRAAVFGRGALFGTGQSLEELAGAVTADFFVVGDVRDLVIQAGRLALDGRADPVLVALSSVGILTTLRPDLDWVPSFLKIVRKAGRLTERMSEAIVRICRRAATGGPTGELVRLADDVGELTVRLSPAGAARVVQHLDDPAELERVAAFVKRHPQGAFALHVTGGEGVRLVKRATGAADDALLIASRKGERGVAWLRSGNARLLRPHPLIGVVRGLYKQNVQKGVAAFTARYLDPYGWASIPAAAGWLLLELWVLWRRVSGPRPFAAGRLPGDDGGVVAVMRVGSSSEQA